MRLAERTAVPSCAAQSAEQGIDVNICFVPPASLISRLLGGSLDRSRLS